MWDDLPWIWPRRCISCSGALYGGFGVSMLRQIQFRVYGIPRPGGSKKAFYNKALGRAMIVDDSKHIKTWKQDVRAAALACAPDIPLHCPLKIRVTFFMPRPKAHYRTGKYAGILKDNAPHVHTKMPDVLKLMRGTEDACSHIIFADDSLIYDEHIRKEYTEKSPGALIHIEWDDKDALSKGLTNAE